MLVLALALPLPAQIGRGPAVFPATLVLVVLTVAWVLDAALRPSTPAPGRRRGLDPVLVAVGLLVLAMAASNIVNGADWRQFWLWLTAGGLFAFARYRLPALLTRRQLGAVLVSMVGVLAVVCTLQVVTGRPIGALAQYFDRSVRRALVYEGLGQGALFKRVQGTFFSVDIFAMFIAYVLYALLGLGRTLRSRALDVAAVVALILVAFTFSRGVWFAVTLTVPALLAWFVYRRRLAPSRLLAAAFVMCALVAVVAVLAPPAVFARFESEQIGQSVGVRTHALEVGVNVIEARPWFGVGYMDFVPASNALGLNPYGNDIRPHNTLVQMWAEQGLFVLLAFLAVPVLLIFEARRGLRRRDRSAQALAAGVVASVAAWCVFMLVYAQANEYSVVPVLMTLCGYSLTLLDTDDRRRPRVPPARPREGAGTVVGAARS